MKQQNIYYSEDDLAFEDKEETILCDGCYNETDGVFYYKDGDLHREDGPACTWREGLISWYLDGLVVYTNSNVNRLSEFKNLPEKFKQSIIKYRLTL
jgi:hypothetical protein